MSHRVQKSQFKKISSSLISTVLFLNTFSSKESYLQIPNNNYKTFPSELPKQKKKKTHLKQFGLEEKRMRERTSKNKRFILTKKSFKSSLNSEK